jgi:hypothetical protein
MSYNINGLSLPTSTRGSTGLYGVSYMPKFTGKAPPFVAYINRPDIEKLEPRLNREAYPYGGEVFNIGSFKTAAEAAFARAYFLANINQLTDWWENNGGPERVLKTFHNYPWEFPNLDSINTPERYKGIKAAYEIYKQGGSQADIIKAAEKARQKNIEHSAQAQAKAEEEDTAIDLIRNNPNLRNVFATIKNKGVSQADVLDDISAYIKQNKSIEEIINLLTQDYINEQQEIQLVDNLLSEMKKLVDILIVR